MHSLRSRIASPSLVFVTSSSLALALGAYLGAGCTGDGPAPCTGPSCVADGGDGGPATGTFDVSAASGEIVGLAGTVHEVDLVVTRAGYQGPITITAEGLPANVSAPPLTVPAGATSAKLALTLLPAATHGRSSISLLATDGGNVRRELPLTLLVRGAPGALDTSFGTAGRIEIEGLPGGAGFGVQGLAVDTEGRIAVAGMSERSLVAARITDRGAVDGTYGGAGLAVARIRPLPESQNVATGVAAASGGKVLVAGYSAPPALYATARFDLAGTLDTTFDADGYWTSEYTKEPTYDAELAMHAIALQSTGAIVLAGKATENRGGTFVSHAVLVRLTGGGAPDATFPGGAGGGGGFLDMQSAANPDALLASRDQCTAVAVGPDDRILCAGFAEKDLVPGTPVRSLFVTRRLADGSPDTSFGFGGVAVVAYPPTNIVGEADSVHALADGKVVVSAHRGDASRKAVVVRLGNDGRPDVSFGTTGEVVLDPLGDIVSQARSIVDAKGNVVVLAVTGADRDLTLIRLLPTGAVDATFGDAGRAIVKLPAKGSVDNARVTIQADGRIVIGGTVDGGKSQAVVYRLWP